MATAAAAAPQAEFGPDSGGRIKGLTLVKPIIYGNVAQYFGKKREEDGHTHQWKVYLKPYNNEDMSIWVKKVHFKLHESYTNQNRVLMKPPYEITETGWGEFEIVIKIYFHDTNERPVTLYHILKLFQSGVAENVATNTTLVSEFYEEVVFHDPTAYMQRLLTTVKPIKSGEWKHDTDFEIKKKKTLENIRAGKAKIREKIAQMKDRLKLAKETIQKFKVDIEKSKEVPMEVTMVL